MLSAKQKSIVLEIIKRFVPQAQVFVFGSRVTGRARPFSDLDLLFVQPERLTLEQRAALTDAFDASDLPFTVDMVDASGLQPIVETRVLHERIALI